MSIEDIETVIRILKDNYQIGTSSRFCDEPADWDEASESELYETVIATLNKENNVQTKD